MNPNPQNVLQCSPSVGSAPYSTSSQANRSRSQESSWIFLRSNVYRIRYYTVLISAFSTRQTEARRPTGALSKVPPLCGTHSLWPLYHGRTLKHVPHFFEGSHEISNYSARPHRQPRSNHAGESPRPKLDRFYCTVLPWDTTETFKPRRQVR